MKSELRTLIEVEQATGTGSQTIKQNLIRDNYTDILEFFLQIGLDPFIKTNINKINIQQEPTCAEISFDQFKDTICKLTQAKAANNELRAEVFQILNSNGFTLQEREMLGKIITKSLNIGMGAKSVNKAIGKAIIPDLSVMLAESDREEIEKWVQHYGYVWVEEKYDGVRVIALKKNGIITFLTRNFNQLIGMSEIEEAVYTLLQNYDNIFIDGELTDLDRKSVSGKINRILKGTAPENIDKDFLLHLFDVEDLDVLYGKKATSTYEIRRVNLENLLKDTKNNIRLSTQWKATSYEEIMGVYKNLVDIGGEGVIIKKPEHIYELKRSKNWNKIKEIQDCDLKIVGWYEGEGKRKGKIGGFHCESSCGELKVNVGSGLSDELINEISQNPNSYVGKIAKVLYNVRITDKHGNNSLFLPRLEEIRNDKVEADDLNKIN